MLTFVLNGFAEENCKTTLNSELHHRLWGGIPGFFSILWTSMGANGLKAQIVVSMQMIICVKSMYIFFLND